MAFIGFDMSPEGLVGTEQPPPVGPPVPPVIEPESRFSIWRSDSRCRSSLYFCSWPRFPLSVVISPLRLSRMLMRRRSRASAAGSGWFGFVGFDGVTPENTVE
ncbi:hypothetical protein BE20_19945 [Sorangium cellulosum]|nr:hypothetical protein BE20_19945 [Sorangium cellulosum]